MIVVVPSRGRPRNIAELIDTFTATCVANTALWVCIDNDDPELENYRDVVREAPSGSTALVIGEPSRIGPILNRVMPDAALRDDVVAFMGDDHRPRTRAWDQFYINNLRSMGTGVVYGNDLFQGENIPTQVAMTSNIVLATGKFVPDGMQHLYLDNVWKDIGQHVGLRYLPDVVVEHVHPAAGKAEWDEGYETNNSPATYTADGIRYNEWKTNELPLWIEQIRNYNA